VFGVACLICWTELRAGISNASSQACLQSCVPSIVKPGGGGLAHAEKQAFGRRKLNTRQGDRRSEVASGEFSRILGLGMHGSGSRTSDGVRSCEVMT
jgi:hypothetical protein